MMKIGWWLVASAGLCLGQIAPSGRLPGTSMSSNGSTVYTPLGMQVLGPFWTGAAGTRGCLHLKDAAGNDTVRCAGGYNGTWSDPATAGSWGQPLVMGAAGQQVWGSPGRAVLTSSTGAIANVATQVIGKTIPADSLAVGSSFVIEASGLANASTSPGNDTFSIEIGAASLSGNMIVQSVPAATASRSNQGVWVHASFTVVSSTNITASIIVCGTSSGAFTSTCKTNIANGAVAGLNLAQDNVVELVYASGASTSNINFNWAVITPQ